MVFSYSRLFMGEKPVPLEKKLITVVNSVTAKEEKLPALVGKVISCNPRADIKILRFPTPRSFRP